MGGGRFILGSGGRWQVFLWVVMDGVEFISSGSRSRWVYLDGAKISRQTKNIAFVLQISESSHGFYHPENESNSGSWKNILVTIISQTKLCTKHSLI